MIDIGGGTFTTPRNVALMEVATRYGLEPRQFPTLAAYIVAVERAYADDCLCGQTFKGVPLICDQHRKPNAGF